MSGCPSRPVPPSPCPIAAGGACCGCQERLWAPCRLRASRAAWELMQARGRGACPHLSRRRCGGGLHPQESSGALPSPCTRLGTRPMGWQVRPLRRGVCRCLDVSACFKQSRDNEGDRGA
eukprot:scaffold693_cov399-Prasinococcus_capsulatus_cf.AAC.21